MTNVNLSWLLAAYQDPYAAPGIIVDTVTAQKTMEELRRRARFEAMLRGVPNTAVSEDALSAMLLWVANSRLTERFVLERGMPRRYINKILARFVQQEAYRQWKQKKHLPLNEFIPASSVEPIVEAEINELEEKCRERLGNDWNAADDKAPPGEPPSRWRVRKCRERQRQWKRVEGLFPGTPRRPRKRR